jgi:hypothetical protein
MSDLIRSAKKFLRPLKKRLTRSGRLDTALAREFDPAWYRGKYLRHDSKEPLEHYLAEGIPRWYSPNGWFDERFYLAFYPDVAKACNEGKILCGFQHYLVAGRQESRVTRHELQKCLEARMPGVTRPLLLDKIGDLAQRLRPISAVKVARASCTVWVLLPTLNPDITFGGYSCVIELIKALAGHGHTVVIICCAERGNIEYFQHCKGPNAFGSAREKVKLVNRVDLSSPIEVGVNDRFIVYSCWDAHLAHELASLTNEPRFAFLVQEYEPAFHEHGSEHAIVNAAYDLPHLPIFNSESLRYFFEQAKLGIFDNRRSKGLREYIVIEHVRARVKAPTGEGMARNGSSRRLVMYARPEQHAARNLLPLGILGLSRAIECGVFAGSWEMLGIGALSAGQKVQLPQGYELILKPKMSVEEYARFIAETDVGISLMYAPHPGLVSFELAEAGIRVVSNTFPGRSSEYLRSISENLVPCDPTIEGIADGIRRAVNSLDDVESRLRGANIPGPRSWEEVFDDKFFDKLSGLIGPVAECGRRLQPTATGMDFR